MKLLKPALALALITLIFNLVKAQQQHPALKFSVNLVVNDYLDLKNALLNDKIALAQNKAGKMVFDLNSVPDRDMTPQQHSAWFNYLGRLQSTSRAIGETTNIEEQRKQFSAISNAMYGLLKDTRLTPITLYRQYSRARDAYWLSNTQAIKNPYYGANSKQMLKEGSTRDILSPGK
ncbi:DUF3347 domain-containing protein [Mucilaginibacter ximonensis]|uniref:DUF3347 domain-containing protein n=1 Tax=Mucilaginibacter ximonensis TaxID=538021 RepID=A0ABW5YHB1_9SPHI